MTERNRLQRAEACIREQTAFYRHSYVPEVQRGVKQWTGVELPEKEALASVLKIRTEKGLDLNYGLR